MEIKRAIGKDGKTYRIYDDRTVFFSIYSIEYIRWQTEETTYWDVVKDIPITSKREEIEEYFNKLIA